jgi:zinc and cadmium transporter
MTDLAWIVLTTVLGGGLSLAGAAAIAFSARASWVPMLISYAIGALLGAAFLEILPEALELAANPARLTGTVLFGILLFFVLEKLVLWRHCHEESCEAHVPHDLHDHGTDQGRSGMMIMVGDTFHNFVDGVIIAAAFLTNTQLGIVTALAIIAHEIPQEVGDFLILLHSGFTRRQALVFNVLTSTAMVLGGMLGYLTVQTTQGLTSPLLGLAAASMIYVAVADLIPGLHRRPQLNDTAMQVLLIALGVGSVWLAGELVHGT